MVYIVIFDRKAYQITRLREVRVLLGFTRVDAPDPDADEQTNIVYLNKGKTEKWLPAAEVHGEGVFIEFNRDSIDAWLRDPELGALSQKYAQCYKEFCESKEYHGQEGNIELGARIHSKELAKQVEDIFTSLVFKRIFVEL